MWAAREGRVASVEWRAECLEGACFRGGWVCRRLASVGFGGGRAKARSPRRREDGENEKTRGRPKNAKTAQNAPCVYSVQVGYSDSDSGIQAFRRWHAVEIVAPLACYVIKVGVR